ncbi:MAG: Wzz/FepE/Etk N-terminal domain-containing protein [candidate division KSB1 bacterium]|nr:Wzz/FepE/Etk N-terminal domain-containing protein [candidate division KSB1 bacterium]
MSKKEKKIIDLIYIMMKWRKLIIINLLIVAILAAGISLILPHVYKANTTILPPQSDAAPLGLSSLLSNMPMAGLGLGSVSSEIYQFISILNSRTIMESVIEKYNLVERYKVENIEEAIEILRENVSENINDDGTLSVACMVKTNWIPKKGNIVEAQTIARDMTNLFVQKLDSINKNLKIESAKSNRIFIENRYMQNINELHKAEEQLKAFQNKHKTVAFEQQTHATIAAAAEIKSQIILKEIELNALLKNAGPSNLRVKSVQNQISALKDKLDDFFTDQDELFVSLGKAPELQIQYARLMRDVMLQQKIMEFILPQYEQAKIQEAKDTPTLQVLDKAVKPIKRSKPHRSIFVIFWSIISIIISIILILTIEYINDQKNESSGEYEKLVEMAKMLKKDFRFYKS